MGHQGWRVGLGVILTDAEALTTLELSLEFRRDRVSKGTRLWQNIWMHLYRFNGVTSH